MNSQNLIPEKYFAQEEFSFGDVGSERVMLAMLMKQPTLILEAERLLPVDAFSYDIHRYIYRIMLWMSQQANTNGGGCRFDAISMLNAAQFLGPAFVTNFREKTNGLQQIQAVEMLIPMAAASQFTYYLNNLMDRYRRVMAYRYARQLQLAALDFSKHPDSRDLCVGAETAFGQLAFDQSNKQGQMRRLGEYQEEVMLKIRLQRQHGMKNLFHLPCKFQFWNKLMHGGLHRKGLIVVCARPKVGKSTLLLDMAIDMALGQVYRDTAGNVMFDQSGAVMWQRPQVPTLYLDTEMSGQEMFLRELAHTSSVAESDIMAGKFYEDGNSCQAIGNALAAITHAPLWYVNIAGKDIDYVKSVMRQFRSQHVGMETVVDQETGRSYTFSRPACVYYDWFKLPDGGGLKHAQETQLIGFQASEIKQTAYELDLPVVAGAQLNRDAIRATPADWEWNAESFISGSDRLAMFCSMLCVLRNLTPEEIELMPEPMKNFRPGKTEEQALKFNQRLHVLLGRNATPFRLGIPMYIDRGYARYEEVADDETMAYVKARKHKKPPVQLSKLKLPTSTDAAVSQSNSARLTPSA